MKPEELDSYAVPSDPQIHPNGTAVAFVVTRMDFEGDRYVRQIHLWDGTISRVFTTGPFDGSPRWSPDGSTLAFVRKDDKDGAVTQLALMPFYGGEAEVVTELGLGVTEISWAPDGRSVAVVGVEYRSEYADLDDDERARVPKRITELPSRFDGLGDLYDKRSGLFLFDVESKAVERLTADTYDVGEIEWRPDGNAIAFVSSQHATKSLDPGAQVWEIDVSGGEPTAMTEVCFGPTPSYSPDGTLHVAMVPAVDGWPDLAPLKRRGSSGEWEDVTPSYDLSLFPIAPKITPAGPQWLADGSFVSVVEDRGSVRVSRFLPDGTVEDLIDAKQAVSG
ncbi:MAG: PD40 domain-containing protein, partial [Acidimicrobiia bacterium]|nr:PD40 domain-containing protein [Acidimicrobiia bacterium]